MIKSMNVVYDNINDLEKVRLALKGYENHDSEKILIQIFSGIIDKLELTKIIKGIQSIKEGIKIVGVTTAGEIKDGRVQENTVLINITVFENTIVKTHLVKQNDDLKKVADEFGEKLKEINTKAVILLGCGLKEKKTINGTKMMDRIGELFPTIIVAGGQAGDNGKGQITYAFTEEGLTDSGVAGASLNSDTLVVYNNYNMSWIPIGKKMTITKVEGSKVYSIDHMPPYEVYKHYLGEEVAKGLPLSAADFPLIIKKEGMVQAIHATGVNPDGSFDFIHNFRLGEQIQFGYCHVGLLAIGANETYEYFKDKNVQVFYVYSCVSRKWVLGSDISIELDPLSKLGTSAGFFSYGEYYYNDPIKKPLFLGQTMTVLGLVEPGKVIEKPNYQYKFADKNEEKSRQFRTLKVLHSLVEKSVREVEDANLQLASLVNMDALTGLYNRRGFDEKLEIEIRKEQYLSVVMVDLDYFKNYNDNYGHVAGDDCLRGIAQILRNVVEKKNYLVARYGGEEFAFILPNTEYDEAIKLAEEVKNSVYDTNFKHPEFGIDNRVTISMGVVTVKIDKESWKSLNAKKLIETCDRQLYKSKEEGRNKVNGIVII